MKKNILITGGAGFIGSHLADELLARGYPVRVFDELTAQVHGPDAERPGYLQADAEFVRGSMEDAAALRQALKGIDAVIHLAARVGVGQSMYQIVDYVSSNNLGTAHLLEALIERPVEQFVVASSMSIYGEGLYRDPNGALVHDAQRSLSQLEDRAWDPTNADGEVLTPLPTPESKVPALSSIYALSKYDQERMCLTVGRAYRIPTTALRFFNVYGARQALSNPYTGVLAIFASQLLNNLPPIVFEDGLQQRDFVNVADAARACRLALETPGAAGRVFNIASGERHFIRSLALRLARLLNRDHIEPEITHRYRVGDIRHCFADTTLAREELGFVARVPFDTGMEQLAEWLQGQIRTARADEPHLELASRGLTL